MKTRQESREYISEMIAHLRSNPDDLWAQQNFPASIAAERRCMVSPTYEARARQMDFASPIQFAFEAGKVLHKHSLDYFGIGWYYPENHVWGMPYAWNHHGANVMQILKSEGLV